MEERTGSVGKMVGGANGGGGDGGSDLKFVALIFEVIELLTTASSTVHRVARGLGRW